MDPPPMPSSTTDDDRYLDTSRAASSRRTSDMNSSRRFSDMSTRRQSAGSRYSEQQSRRFSDMSSRRQSVGSAHSSHYKRSADIRHNTLTDTYRRASDGLHLRKPKTVPDNRRASESATGRPSINDHDRGNSIDSLGSDDDDLDPNDDTAASASLNEVRLLLFGLTSLHRFSTPSDNFAHPTPLCGPTMRLTAPSSTTSSLALLLLLQRLLDKKKKKKTRLEWNNQVIINNNLPHDTSHRSFRRSPKRVGGESTSSSKHLTSSPMIHLPSPLTWGGRVVGRKRGTTPTHETQKFLPTLLIVSFRLASYRIVCGSVVSCPKILSVIN